MRIAILAILLLLSVGAQAATVLIDFEEVTPTTDGQLTVESKGYTFFAAGSSYSEPFAGVSSQGVFSNGNCFPYGPGCSVSVSMESINGGPFAIHSFAVFFDEGLMGGVSLFEGTLVGGGIADLSVPVGTGDWLALESFLVSAQCNSSGSCSYYTVRLDDVTVSAVPIPAAAWLLGSAFAVLGWFRRNS